MSDVEQLFLKDSKVWQHLVDEAQLAWLGEEFLAADQYFAQFIQCTTPWLKKIAYSGLPVEECDEVVAETYVQFWSIVATGGAIVNAKGLIGTILRRRIVDFHRQNKSAGMVKRRQAEMSFFNREAARLALEADDPGKIGENVPEVKNFILDILPRNECEVLIARHVDHLSVKDTATRLGLSIDQVKKLTRKAVQAVKTVALARRLIKHEE